MASSQPFSSRRRPSRLRTWLWRALLTVLVPVLVMPVVVAVFVGARCYAPAPRTWTASLDPPGVPGYTRAEAFTFLTLPEWYVVYSAEEQARFIQHSSPSDFPYASAIAQYWSVYGASCDVTRERYPFQIGYHAVLSVIGMSVTAEYGVRLLYENTIGLATSRWFTTDTDEDRFAAAVSRDYAAFIHRAPWYRFSFEQRLSSLWSQVPLWGPHAVRKWERRLALTAEYGVKGAYGWLLSAGSRTTYGDEALTTYARVVRANERDLAAVAGSLVQRTRGGDLVKLPRYEAFTPAALALVERGARFVDIAGNRRVLVSVLAPATFDVRTLTEARLVARELTVSRPDQARFALEVSVPRLPEAIGQLRKAKLKVEHIYDY